MKKYLGVFLCNTNDRIRIQIRLQVINSYPRPAKIPKFGFGRIRIHISDGSNYIIKFKTNDSHGTVVVLQTFYNFAMLSLEMEFVIAQLHWGRGSNVRDL